MYPIATMCRVLEVSTSGYYAWLKRPSSAHARRAAELRNRIVVGFHEAARQTLWSAARACRLKANGQRVARRRRHSTLGLSS
jgi:hypothetical protein